MKNLLLVGVQIKTFNTIFSLFLGFQASENFRFIKGGASVIACTSFYKLVLRKPKNSRCCINSVCNSTCRRVFVIKLRKPLINYSRNKLFHSAQQIKSPTKRTFANYNKSEQDFGPAPNLSESVEPHVPSQN